MTAAGPQRTLPVWFFWPRLPGGSSRASAPGAGIWGPLAFLGTTLVLSTILVLGISSVLVLVLPEPVVDFMYGYGSTLPGLWSVLGRLPGLESGYTQSLAPPLGPLLRGLDLFNDVVFSTLAELPLYVAVILLYIVFAHLFLVVTRGSRPHGFRGTLAAGCYASAAAFLGVIPVAGTYLVLLGVVALAGLGLHVVQRSGVVRAAGFALCSVPVVWWIMMGF